MGFQGITAVVMTIFVFWDITACIISWVRNQRQSELCFPPSLTLLSRSAYSSILTMEAICSSETSTDFQRATRRYIPEERTLHAIIYRRPSLLQLFEFLSPDLR
jgi:hypothetical protein